MKIYIAGPLFNQAERTFNERIDAILRKAGHETYLPQRDGGQFAKERDKAKFLFETDLQNLNWCDTILFLFDGRVPDEGACFELGYAYASHKRCIGYRTDARGFIGNDPNLMLCQSVEHILTNEEELISFFQEKTV